MITLEQVSDMVKKLQTYAMSSDMNEDVLRQKNRDLFFTLLQNDSFFFVAASADYDESVLNEKSFLPFIASVNSESPIPYLRIFSHKDAAIKFMTAVGLPAKCCVSLSAVESAQLAKYWFLRGVYGFMLNDGFQWATISFSEYLSMIFEDLLGRPEMYNEEYVAWISFLVLMDNNEPFSFSKDESGLNMRSDSTGIATLADILQNKGDEDLKLTVEHPLIHSYTGSLQSFLRAMDEYHPGVQKKGGNVL